MNYTAEKISSNRTKLTFRVSAEAFEGAMQQAYLKLRKRISVPGFRKGKAPRKLIERMYGEATFMRMPLTRYSLMLTEKLSKRKTCTWLDSLRSIWSKSAQGRS